MIIVLKQEQIIALAAGIVLVHSVFNYCNYWLQVKITTLVFISAGTQVTTVSKMRLLDVVTFECLLAGQSFCVIKLIHRFEHNAIEENFIYAWFKIQKSRCSNYAYFLEKKQIRYAVLQ